MLMKTKNLFKDYFQNATPLIQPEYRIKEIEVWKTTSAQLDIKYTKKSKCIY